MAPDPDTGSVDWNDVLGFAVALTVTAGFAWALVALFRHGWTMLPLWLALVLCIALAVVVIGTPIYTLWRWSERYLARTGHGRNRAR